MADDSFLKQAYQLKNTADTIALYQEWAESYDNRCGNMAMLPRGVV